MYRSISTLNLGNIRQQMNLIQQTVIAEELLTDNDLLIIRETLFSPSSSIEGNPFSHGHPHRGR
jgi:hypothetical protein